jgi:hypothetical protein
MGDIWQEHRKFIMSVVAGGLLLLVGVLLIDGTFDGRIQAARARINRAKADQKQALPAGYDLRKAVENRGTLEAGYDGLRTAVARVPAKEWRIGSDVADSDLYYNAQLERFRNGTLEACAVRNIDVDQRLGLPDAFPSQRSDQEHWMRGLDVVEQVLVIALAAERDVEGGIARVERIEIDKPEKKGPGAKTPFVSGTKVSLSVVGHPRAVAFVVRALAQDNTGSEALSGRWLAVEKAVVTSLDFPPDGSVKERKGADPNDRRRVEARFDLRALDVNPEGALR